MSSEMIILRDDFQVIKNTKVHLGNKQELVTNVDFKKLQKWVDAKYDTKKGWTFSSNMDWKVVRK